MSRGIFLGCFAATVCMQCTLNAEQITPMERELRVNLLKKSWQIAVDQRIKQDSLALSNKSDAEEKIWIAKEYYDSSVYDRIGELIGQCVYFSTKDQMFIGDGIFTLKGANASKFSVANWNYMLLANFLNKTLTRANGISPNIECDLSNNNTLKDTLSIVASRMSYVFKCDEQMKNKLVRAVGDIFEYAKATNLGSYIMLQNKCTRRRTEGTRAGDSNTLVIAPLVMRDRSYDKQIGRYMNFYVITDVPFEESFIDIEKNWDDNIRYMTFYHLKSDNSIYNIQRMKSGRLASLNLDIEQQLKHELKGSRQASWHPHTTATHKGRFILYVSASVDDYITVLEEILINENDDIKKIRRIFEQLEELYNMPRPQILPAMDKNNRIANYNEWNTSQKKYLNHYTQPASGLRKKRQLFNELKYKVSKKARAELRRQLAEENRK